MRERSGDGRGKGSYGGLFFGFLVKIKWRKGDKVNFVIFCISVLKCYLFYIKVVFFKKIYDV